jgi:hypothetical protein
MDDKISGNEKGKAKVTDPGQGGIDADKATMGSRVMESAKGLLRDAINSSTKDAANAISSSLALGNKAQSSGSSNSLSILDGAVLQARPQGSASDASGTGHVATESFRTQPVTNSTEEQFAQFTVQDGLTSDLTRQDHEIPGVLEQAWHSSSAGTFDAQSQLIDQKAHQAQYDDGAEVRTLLSDPNFMPDMDDLELGGLEGTSVQTINDLFPQNFSAEEQHAVKQLKSSLPPPPVYRPTPADHPLNLRPRSDEENHAIGENLEDILSGAITPGEMSLVFGSTLQKNKWLADWDSVLSSYADEVWRDILPVVRETKSHLEEVRAGNATLDSKAVARLRMVLAHLEQYNI